MELGIKGRTALVLGGGGGLGRAIAVSLAREGANVALGDVNAEALAQSQDAVTAAGGRALAIEWNLADHASFEKHFTGIEKTFGPVDILVNNTGGPPPTPASVRTRPCGLEAVSRRWCSRSSRSPTGCCRRCAAASGAASSPRPPPASSRRSPIWASPTRLRLSLVGWSKTLAREVGRDGITANIVLPGRIATARITFLDEQKAKREGKRTVEDVVSESTATHSAGPLWRPAGIWRRRRVPGERARVLLTGSVIRVDGGMIQSI